MAPELFGIEHILYIVISTIIGGVGLFLAYKYAKDEKKQNIILKIIAVLFGKKNNSAYHFLWLLGLFGGISTVIYASFVGQGPTIFYIPTFTGLLHHSFSAILVVGLLMFKQIDITYKKWYCTLFGFTSYLTLGAFLMHTFNLSDAFHIAEPLLPNTPLTAWVMGPMYAASYAVILFTIEIYKKKRNATSSEK